MNAFRRRDGVWVAWAERGRFGAYATARSEEDAIAYAIGMTRLVQDAATHEVLSLPSKVQAGSDVVSGLSMGCAYRVGGVR